MKGIVVIAAILIGVAIGMTATWVVGPADRAIAQAEQVELSSKVPGTQVQLPEVLLDEP